MEGDAVANSGCARWNPTKEQIDMLEGLYRSGFRTPTAEQIQRITTRLRAFGNIEGKNVFYWFQNHKARQRQKQKQDTISYLNRFLRHKTSVLMPPCANVVCSPPYCVPYADIGLCHHHQQQQPKVLLPRTRPPPVPEKMMATTTTLPPYYDHHQEYNYQCMDMIEKGCNQQTLELFPLEPSGNLQARTSSSTSSTSNEDLNYKCISNDDDYQQSGGGIQLFL